MKMKATDKTATKGLVEKVLTEGRERMKVLLPDTRSIVWSHHTAGRSNVSVSQNTSLQILYFTQMLETENMSEC